MLPFYLAASAGSSGGGGGDLYGLSPEQIGNITGQDIAGGELSRRGIDSIYTNLQAQAQTDLLDRSGYPTPTAPVRIKPQYSTAQINANTGTWWAFNENTGKSEDTGIKVTASELKGASDKGFKPSYQVTERVLPNGTRERVVLKDGQPFQSLGPYPEGSEATARSFKQARDVGDIEARILGKTKDAFTPKDADTFNEFSDANYIYVHRPGKVIPWARDKKPSMERIDLPRGMNASAVYETAKLYNMSAEDVVLTLDAHLKRRK